MLPASVVAGSLHGPPDPSLRWSLEARTAMEALRCPPGEAMPAALDAEDLDIRLCDPCTGPPRHEDMAMSGLQTLRHHVS